MASVRGGSVGAASYSPQVEDAIVSTGRVDAVSVNAPSTVDAASVEGASVEAASSTPRR
jgi:hypothetical protein